MAVLREVKGTREFPLSAKVTLIGRSPACDIVVDSRQTSGRHAMILNSGGIYYVEDLNSSNGTYVNRERIRERTRLQPGDLIEIYGLAVTFVEEEPADDLELRQTMTVAEIPSLEAPPEILSSLDIGAELRVTVKPEAKLRALLDISRNLAGTLDLKVVLPRILDSLLGIFPQADRGLVLLRDSVSGELSPGAVRGEQGRTGVPTSRAVLNHVLLKRQAVLSEDAGIDQRFDMSESIRCLGIRSVMCVPMLSQSGDILGVIQIDTRDQGTPFRPEDLEVLACAATQAARVVELAGLYEEQREVLAATRIQKSFLPNEQPVVEGLRFFDHYSPAQHVGGDYYDYIPLPGNRLAVALGDVAGKGVSAALLMARLSAAVRFCLATERSVPAAVRRLNAVLTRSGVEDRFVTFVVAVLDLSSFSLTLVNAGHMPPLCRTAWRGAAVDIGERVVGLPLGVIDRPYEEEVLTLEPGALWVLYTDGVTEARGPGRELYGVDRLRAAVKAAPDNVEALGQAILADVHAFTGDRPQHDDVTLVCFGRDR
jgi:phosphoserine phosphatase RsbU/P